MKEFCTAFAVIFIAATSSAWSTTTVINPSIDGALLSPKFNPVVFLQGGYFLTGPNSQGVVRFQTPTNLHDGDSATLTLYPAGLPLRGPVEYVYAYESNDLIVATTEYNAGAFLGQIDIPANSNFSSKFTFDVTSIIKSTKSPYVTFNLRSDGDNSFTAINGYSFQTPTQLTVTSIPELGTFALMGVGLLALGIKRLI